MTNQESDQTILIVDDTPENIDVLSEILSNYKRKVATNGERAIKIASSENPPDIILLDILMPGMDGFQVCEILKSNPKTMDIPIIFITSKNEIEDEMHGLKLGAVDFLTKPISPPIVLARIRNQLELKHSKKLVEEQNQKLLEHNRHITDSIKYARQIQRAILPSEETIKKVFPDSFVIYLPKDIVSGDFYWINEVEELKIIAVGDCTGHGVPGALMSMIGNTLLNDIILGKGQTDPGIILNLLDKGIVDVLRKDHSESTFDSIDAAICVINEQQKNIRYSSANRNIIVVDETGLNIKKGKNKSIGDLKRKGDYQMSEFTFTNNTSIYLTTDGFADQHNEIGIKFGTRNLNELILNSYGMEFNLQKEKMLNTLNDHKKLQIQRDDITIVGIKLS